MIMAMHHGHHIGACAKNLGMDEALQIDSAAIGVERASIEIESDNIISRDETRCHIAREQKAIGMLVMPRADMAETIDHTLFEQNPVGGCQIRQQASIGRLGSASIIRNGFGNSRRIVKQGGAHGCLLFVARHQGRAATVHEQIGADDEAGIIRHKEENGIGQINRHAGAADKIFHRTCRIEIILADG